MLGVSLRLPQPCDLSGALHRYIQSNYTAEESKSVSQACISLGSLRTKLESIIINNPSDSHQSIDLLLQYYQSLLSISGRLPFGNQQQATTLGIIKTGPVPTVKCLFSWFDSFKHNNRVQDYDIAFEKASIVFNLGALYSRQATSIKSTNTTNSTDSDNSLKEACRLFQISSGIFDYLLHCRDLGAASGLSIDLASEALGLLHQLMLAQAAACFFERATVTASPKLVAKLAMGVAELFKLALTEANKQRIASLSGKSDGKDTVKAITIINTIYQNQIIN